jgi:putative ATP-dependent endonuclease of the OLD family
MAGDTALPWSEAGLKVSHLAIANFRGVKSASLLLPDHAVLIGDNNTGKSTVLEALDLVLGPDRLSRASPIDEHDFHLGRYQPEAQEAHAGADAAQDGASPTIRVTATITGLSEEQSTHFRDHLEWWNTEKQTLYDGDAAALDKAPAVPCLRVTFIGRYDADEDDFEGKTFFHPEPRRS